MSHLFDRRTLLWLCLGLSVLAFGALSQGELENYATSVTGFEMLYGTEQLVAHSFAVIIVFLEMVPFMLMVLRRPVHWSVWLGAALAYLFDFGTAYVAISVRPTAADNFFLKLGTQWVLWGKVVAAIGLIALEPIIALSISLMLWFWRELQGRTTFTPEPPAAQGSLFDALSGFFGRITGGLADAARSLSGLIDNLPNPLSPRPSAPREPRAPRPPAWAQPMPMEEPVVIGEPSVTQVEPPKEVAAQILEEAMKKAIEAGAFGDEERWALNRAVGRRESLPLDPRLVDLYVEALAKGARERDPVLAGIGRKLVDFMGDFRGDGVEEPEEEEPDGNGGDLSTFLFQPAQ